MKREMALKKFLEKKICEKKSKLIFCGVSGGNPSDRSGKITQKKKYKKFLKEYRKVLEKKSLKRFLRTFLRSF